MTSEEQAAYDAAIRAVHAVNKYLLAIDAAIDHYDSGQLDTPGNRGNIEAYFSTAKAEVETAITLHDELTG